MKIEKIIHDQVQPDGTFSSLGGAIETKGKIVMSQADGGCDLDNCKCSEGHWITIVLPRTKGGVVEGVKVKFDNKAEMDKFLNDGELIGDA